MGNITETSYFEKLQAKLEDDFKFTELKRPIEEELLDLKNDVLQIIETLDLIRQAITNLNHKLDIEMKIFKSIIDNKTKENNNG